MTRPVDVLAVMARAAEYHRDEARVFAGGAAESLRESVCANAEQQAKDLADARATVAELIEAAAAEHFRAGRPIFGPGMESYDRLSAALAKVQP